MQRMLIVEDERDIADCLQEFFAGQGFAVSAAFSGEEALERLSVGGAEVVLLDILLPGLSGIEVLRRVKTLCPAARIVMVTALDREDLRLQAYHYGACGFVTKPFDFSQNTWSVVFAPAVTPKTNPPQSPVAPQSPTAA